MRLLIVLLVLLIPLGAYIAHAQQPVQTSTPTPILPGVPDSEHALLVVYVINDLNGNGLRDAGEPGVEGWSVDQACGDLLAFLGTTDATGRMLATVRLGEPCFLLDVPFGWLATGGNSRVVGLSPGATAGVVFLVHHVGEQLANFGGSVIVNALPAPPGTSVDAIVNGRDCGEPDVVRFSSYATNYSLYVLSAQDRPGCAVLGDQVSLTVNGSVVATETFLLPLLATRDLILGPAPMYFYLQAPQGTTPVPYAGSFRCGEARSSARPPVVANYYVIYVLPDALRGGCGAPGRTVTIKAGGQVILQLPWHEGLLGDIPPFTPIPDVILPEGGSAESSPSGNVAMLALLGAASLAILALGFQMARRSRL